MLAGAPAADILTHLPTGPRSPHGSAHAMGTGTGENRCAGSATPNTACSSNGRIIDPPLTVDCNPTQVSPAVVVRRREARAICAKSHRSTLYHDCSLRPP